MGQKMQSKWKFTPLRMAWITLYLIEHWPLFELKSSLIFLLHVRRHPCSGKLWRCERDMCLWRKWTELMHFGYITTLLCEISKNVNYYILLLSIPMWMWTITSNVNVNHYIESLHWIITLNHFIEFLHWSITLNENI